MNLERSDIGVYSCRIVNDAGEGTSLQPYLFIYLYLYIYIFTVSTCFIKMCCALLFVCPNQDRKLDLRFEKYMAFNSQTNICRASCRRTRD